jgi:type IV pilus assembly protein PilA
MFKLIRNMKVRDERGFTLVELLIVIAIISILAAIAIPQFAAYRARALEASMVADARNIATALEAVFADCQTYPTGNVAAGASLTFARPAGCPADVTMPTVRASAGNTIGIVGGTTFTITVTNPGGRPDRTRYTLNNLGETTWAAAPAP